MRPTKIPKKLPLFLVKAEWQGTATLYKINGKNEVDAKDRMWRQIARTEGGDSCLKVTVIKEIE